MHGETVIAGLFPLDIRRVSLDWQNEKLHFA